MINDELPLLDIFLINKFLRDLSSSEAAHEQEFSSYHGIPSRAEVNLSFSFRTAAELLSFNGLFISSCQTSR